MRQVLRLLALWTVLFAAYLLAPAAAEPAHLRIAAALVDRGELLREPEGIGFPLLIAPAYAVGAVEPFLAAIAALGFVLAALLARRVVPEPYASAGAAFAGLSLPALTHGAAALPELTAGTLLAGAALCAVGARERPRVAPVIGGAAMLALLPWLGVKFLVPALPVAVALAVWTSRAGRRLLGLVAAEIVVGSLVFYATLNERLYGGPTPYPANPTGADTPLEFVERVPRLLTLWIDTGHGLLRWAPFVALAPFAAWLLWRSRRERIAAAIPARALAEAAAGLALAIVAGRLLVAAFGAPAADGRLQLVAALPAAAVLCAWGLRHAPRTGAALAAITLALSAWLLVAGEPPPPR